METLKENHKKYQKSLEAKLQEKNQKEIKGHENEN